MYVNVKDLPASLISALKEISYRKGDIKIEVAEQESLSSFGCEGYQNFTLVVNISSGEIKTFMGSWGGANINALDNIVDLHHKMYTLPPDCAMIKGYRGGARGGVRAEIILSPHNVIKGILPESTSLTPEQIEVLSAVRKYTSAYRKYILKGSPDVVSYLTTEGYLKCSKSGAISITMKGKNAVEQVVGY